MQEHLKFWFPLPDGKYQQREMIPAGEGEKVKYKDVGLVHKNISQEEAKGRNDVIHISAWFEDEDFWLVPDV